MLFAALVALTALSKSYSHSHLLASYTGENETISSIIHDDINNNNNANEKKKTVFITGATGVMGFATLLEMSKNMSGLYLKVLVRDSRRNRNKMSQFAKIDDIEIIWGDFLDYGTVFRGVSGCDYVLHIGGIVSPLADDKPYETERVNVGAAKIITKAVKAQPNAEEIKVCYIGSVAETGDRNYPIHWGRTGDPIKVSVFDHYGLSKVIAERIFVESGLKKWVVFRQSGILHSGLMHHLEPIMYSVPLNGVLEWATVEDSARLMNNFVRFDLQDEFFCKFYNIGSGENYRLTNYQFESLLLGALGIEPIEGLFEPNWFATRNFHGHFYADSDKLDEILKFRMNIPAKEYFDHLASQTEFYFRIPKLIRWKKIITIAAKPFMKMIANTKVFGILDWIKTGNRDRITAFFGSIEQYRSIPSDWSEFKIEEYNTSITESNKFRLNHGYDEKKPLKELDIEDMQSAAKYRGGECVSMSMKKGDLSKKLIWKCGHCGKYFMASPNLILLGGHWCPNCYVPHKRWDYDSIAKTNEFFAQVWYPNHSHDEHNVYEFSEIFSDPAWKK